MGPGLSFGIDMGILYQGEEECGSGHLNPGKEVRADFSHEDWDDKPEPVEWASPHGSGSFQLISDEEQAGGLPTESQSGGSEPPSIPRQVEPTKAANPPVKALFDDVPADEVPPPLGPLVVVASIRKTGNPPKRKLHLLDREGKAVGCGWTPDLAKISGMTKTDFDEEPDSLIQCARCFQRFALPTDWAVRDPPDNGGDSDSSVSLGSLTDSSVDTASESERVTLASVVQSHPTLPLQ